MDEEIIHINTSHLVCIQSVLREKRHTSINVLPEDQLSLLLVTRSSITD